MSSGPPVCPCRCGFDVPVLLRSSEETESILPPPEKHMVQVTNPFGLELISGPASITGKSGCTCECTCGSAGQRGVTCFQQSFSADEPSLFQPASP